MSATGTVSIFGARQERRHGRVLRAAVWLAGAGAAVKIASAGKEFVLAGIYGRSDAMDALLIALLVPNLLVNLVAESMNQALIPTLIRVRMREGQIAGQKLLSSALFWLLALLTGVAVVVALSSKFMFPAMAHGFSHGKLALSMALFYLLLPMILLSGVASLCTAVLNSCEEFALPALAPVVVPLITIGAAVALHARLGIWAVAWAILTGTLLHATLMVGRMQTRGCAFRPRWSVTDEATREVRRQFVVVALSSMVASGGLLVDQAMAAALPAGSVSALVFAGRFVSVALALLAGAISQSVTPYFSSMVAQNDWTGCRSALRRWAGTAALVAVPLAVALIGGAPWLVKITLQHGAFHGSDTAAVTPVLAMYAIQIPFFAVSRVFYRFVLAMRRSDIVLWCGGINLVLDIVLNLVLMRWMGVAGIALATSLWAVSTCGFLCYWAWRLVAQAEPRPT